MRGRVALWVKQGLRVRFSAGKVWVDEQIVDLSPKEYDLLVYFIQNEGLLLSREQLLENVWGYEYYGDIRTVDTHVNRIRLKIAPYDGFIQTIRGKGYRFEESYVTILNEFLLLTLIIFLIVAWIGATRFANYFSKPIVNLQRMTHRMIQLDFSERWTDARRDELGDLGQNMNKLMSIIGQFIEELRGKNELLESELKRKTSMERMQKQFVSNVSHELKTPIALIQGYAEGLRQNVHEDTESRNEYCDVIIDEAKKMNELVCCHSWNRSKQP